MSYKKNTIIIILLITFFLVVSACESEVEVNVIYDSEKGEVEGMGEYKKGETVTLKAIPKDGYEFVYWVEEDEAVSSSDQYSFQANSNKEFKAEFEKQKFRVEVIYDKDHGDVLGEGEYSIGETVEINVVENEGYNFEKFILNDHVYTERKLQFDINKDTEILAEFSRRDDIVRIITSASEGGQVISSKKYYEKGEEVIIKAIPKPGYFFGAWTREDTGFRFNDLFETSKELTIKASEDMHIKANFRKFDDPSRKSSRVIVNENKISSNDDYFAYLKDNKIKIFNTKNKEEILTHELKENLTPSFLTWGNNDELLYFVQNKIYKLYLDGETELIKDTTDIYQGVYEGSVQFKNIDNNDLFVYYNVKNVVMTEELFRGDLIIEGFISENKVISIKDDFQIEGGFSNLVFSPDFNKAAISINGTTRIYDLMNRENDSKHMNYATISDEFLYGTKPFMWLDDDSLLLIEGDWLMGGGIPGGNLIKYSVESEQYIYIYKSTDIPLEVSENSLSPKGDRLIARIGGEMTLLEVNYESESALDNSEILSYQVNITPLELDVWTLINIFWYDNSTSFIEDKVNNKVYLLKNNKLEIFLEDVEEVLGIANEELIYIDLKGSVEVVEIE